MGRNRRKHKTRKELPRGPSRSNDTQGSRSVQPDVAEEFHREGFHHEGFCPEEFLAFQFRSAVAVSSFFYHLGLVHHIIATSWRYPHRERAEFRRDSSDEEYVAEGFHREGFCHGGSCHSELHENRLHIKENISVVPRKEWKAKMPKHVPVPRVLPFSTVFVVCFNGNIFPRSCEVINKMQAMQAHQMKYLDDIMSHFVVANDGKIYEGRGWDLKGEHENTIKIDFIVNSIEDVPSKEELDECKKIIREGVRLSKIRKDYCLITNKNHRLYDELVSWDNFSPSGCL